MVVNWGTETFQLECPRFVFDRSETQSYEDWCSDKGVDKTAIVLANLHPLDPSIKEIYFPPNPRSPPEIRWKKQIHRNRFLGWKIKSKTPEVNTNLASTINHLKLQHIITHNNVDEIIRNLQRDRFSNKTYQFILRGGDRKFETMIQELNRKFQGGNSSQRSEIIELLIRHSPTTFLHLWEYSNRYGKEIQNYMYP